MIIGHLYDVLCMNDTVNCHFLIYILNIKFLHKFKNVYKPLLFTCIRLHFYSNLKLSNNPLPS